MNNNKDFDQVSGIFDQTSDLSGLADDLNRRGIAGNNLSLLMSDRTREQFFAPVSSTKTPEGATTGGLSGGLLGALIGGLAMVGSITVPGLGLLVAGPIVGALAGGAIGSATGSLIGALVGAGIPEYEAKYYEDALKENGKILLVAHVPHEQSREIKAVFERYGAHQIKVKS